MNCIVYEQLNILLVKPSLCYWCGGLTHDDRDCDLWVQSNGTLTLDKQQFGPSLRAPPYTSAGKDFIYVLGYYERKGGRKKTQSRGEGGDQNVAHQNSVTMSPVEAKPIMEEEGRNDRRTEEAVTKLNAQQILGVEIDSVEIMRDKHSLSKNQEVIKANGKSTNSSCLSQFAEFDKEVNYSSSAKATDRSLNGELKLGNNIKDPTLNAITTNSLGLENDNISLASILAASHQTNHVITNSCDELNISTAEINVQPTNIRSWKRIMRQANLTGAANTLDLKKKRKVSTCM